MRSDTGEPSNDLLAHIAWSRITEPGDTVAHTLIRALGVVPAFDWLATTSASTPPGVAPDPRWEKTSSNWRSRLAGLDPRREYSVITSLGGAVLTEHDPRWPAQLRDLGERAPLCLWVRGDARALNRSGVGIVGARACTRYGERVAQELGSGASQAGLTVISGGAFGIDAAAHRAALASESTTIAFQAGGVDRFYPLAHTDLLQRVCESGAVVSEAPPGSAPMRQRFLMRNRLIAALSAAVIVVEASWRSGALSTARHAADLMRPVGAVPGPVTSMASAGCHRLIRDGMAVCVTDAAEMLELTGPLAPEVDPETTQEGFLDGLDDEAARVLDAFPARSGTTTDALVHVAGLAPKTVVRALGTLQLAGRIKREGGQWKRRD